MSRRADPARGDVAKRPTWNRLIAKTWRRRDRVRLDRLVGSAGGRWLPWARPDELPARLGVDRRRAGAPGEAV